jgi:hypothetical protein
LYFITLHIYIILLCSKGNANVQEQNGRASVDPVDAARVSSWLGGTGEAPSDAAKHPPIMESFAEFQKFEGVLNGLKDLQDNALRSLFTEYAKDAVPAAEASTPDIKCLSKKDLAELFKDKYGVSLSEGKLEELISRSDANGDGVIDFNEFRTLVRSTSDLEMIFKSLPLAQVLAFCFPKGSAGEPLEALFNQQHSQVDAAMGKAGQILTGLTMSMIEKNNKARVAAKKQQAAGGAKYGAELKGGTVEKFFEGVTGICGEPNPGVSECECERVRSCACVCVYDNEHSCVT